MLIFILKLFFTLSEKMSEKVSEFSLLHFSYVFSHLWQHIWFSFIHSVIFSCSFIIIDYHLLFHHWVSFVPKGYRYNIYVLTVDYHSFYHHWVSFVLSLNRYAAVYAYISDLNGETWGSSCIMNGSRSWHHVWSQRGVSHWTTGFYTEFHQRGFFQGLGQFWPHLCQRV